MSDISPALDTVIGGWQFNTNATISSGLPFDVGYRDSGADRDTGPGRVNLIGDPSGPQTQDQWFNVTPIGASGTSAAVNLEMAEVMLASGDDTRLAEIGSILVLARVEVKALKAFRDVVYRYLLAMARTAHRGPEPAARKMRRQRAG